jgi:N-acetylmuramoyl-L-alanine amidase
LIKSGEKKKFRHNWENTINKFLKVVKAKNDPKAADATFMVGELYRMLYTYSSAKNDLRKAIKYYKKVASDYPKNSLADDSIYNAGEIYEKKLKDFKNAYLSYLRVTKEFKKGDMISKARSKLIRLKKYAPKKKVEKKKKEAAPLLPSDMILIDDIKYWSEKDSTRVVIYPEKSIDYKYNYLKANKKNKTPPRIYIDFYNTKLNPAIKRFVKVKDGLLRSIRSDQNDTDIVRVVLDIQSIKSYRIFAFEDPFRIVVDVSGERSEVITSKKGKKGSDFKPISSFDKDKNINYTLAKQLGLGVKKIVVDPGHGGRDPGAVGVNNVKEKDITLKISKKLKAIIEENLDCEVVLTRDKDVFVSLEARTAIARREKADLFISVHTNASEKKNLRGIETYYLNFATDEHAMKTASRENATSKLTLSDLEGIVKIIRYSNVEESAELAHKVQKAIVGTLSKSYKGTRSLGVKQAPFYVLFGSKKPSILIETSFIDHKVEGKRLQNDKYVTALAQSIFNGIDDYIEGFKIAARN